MRIDEKGVTRKWKKNHEDVRANFDSLEDYRRFKRFILPHEQELDRLESEPMRRLIANDELRRVLKATFNLVDRQAEQLGLSNRVLCPSVATVETVHAAIVESIDRMTAMIDRPERDGGTVTQKSDGRAVSGDADLVSTILRAVAAKYPSERPKPATIKKHIRNCRTAILEEPHASIERHQTKAGGRARVVTVVLQCLAEAGEVSYD